MSTGYNFKFLKFAACLTVHKKEIGNCHFFSIRKVLYKTLIQDSLSKSSRLFDGRRLKIDRIVMREASASFFNYNSYSQMLLAMRKRNTMAYNLESSLIVIER